MGEHDRPRDARRVVDGSIAQAVRAYEQGSVTNRELIDWLIDLLAPTNIAQIVDATPTEVRDSLLGRLRDLARDGERVSIFGGIHCWEIDGDEASRAAHERERAREAREFEREIQPAIRAWLEQHAKSR